MISNSILHHTLIKHIIDKGFAPDLLQLSDLLSSTPKEVKEALYRLEEYHGVVLHPNEPKVWVIHPFSLAPTNFLVKSQSGIWWGNCAWCSLGVAALLKEDLSIYTTIGGHSQSIEIKIKDGEIQNKDLFIHFPIPMKNAWDNVIYTCSTMLVFQSPEQIEDWSDRHKIPTGDIQPIEKIWNFSQEWYGQHLDPDWKKWTIDEAKTMFAEHELNHPIWNLDSSGERF